MRGRFGALLGVIDNQTNELFAAEMIYCDSIETPTKQVIATRSKR